MSPETTAAEPRAVHRSEYRPPTHRIERVDLAFELMEHETLVHARMDVIRAEGAGTANLELAGEDLETCAVRVDGRLVPAERLTIEPERLVIHDAPERFVLETEVRIHPEQNLQLSGLYKSSGNFCTQCEAEGFRRITWFLDRPDVMTRYTTTITAEKKRYPVLLSNGNRVLHEELELGHERHRVRWEDPFPKPSYLFALVAGDLHCHEGTFTTRSGREIALEIYVEHKDADKCEHALRSLQRAMKWDEEVFGLEYDLDLYMIVAVSDFNMGAMENKGLNIFNSKFVLARPDTATDGDYEAIEGVIAHEYFHNWTGNRVTCRDWFQLTLKEGLTVFRDEQFTADHHSAAVQRIEKVRQLRARQFPEDAGPMSHPIRPESYISMDNFYTATVYEKGAEVIRMYHTLLGAQGFRKGMDLYFERHDGQAVTCDDFRAAMADANGRDLTQFERWYTTRGTPRLVVSGEHDAANKQYRLTLKQEAPSNLPAEEFAPLHVPVALGLIGRDGRELPLKLAGRDGAPTTLVHELTTASEELVFEDVAEPPAPSVLRNFSAPMELELERAPGELEHLLAHDADPFQRWEAGQVLFGDEILRLVACHQRGEPLVLKDGLAAALGRVLTDPALDGSLKANMLALPPAMVLAQAMDVVDPDALQAARWSVRKQLARDLADELRETYRTFSPKGGYAVTKQAIDARAIKNACLGYLVELESGEGVELADQQFQAADNMTDSQAALACLVSTDSDARRRAFEAFYARWKDDALVLDKWFTLQALSPLPDVADQVEELTGHPDFNPENPNRLRSLIGAFAASNLAGFHRKDGAGYRLLARYVLLMQAKNPQVSSRLVSAFNQWKRFDAARQDLQKAELERIAAEKDLSKDVYEIVSRALSS